MIRLVADAGFPASVEQHRSERLEIHRWTGERLSDLGLVRDCETSGLDGIIFLGPQPLYSPQIRQAAQAAHLYLAGTLESEPFEAVRVIGNVFGQLEREARGGSTHVVLARELRPFI